MKRPVITLLTDFGTSDHYVAAMKGVMLGICFDARLVDISHQIEPYGIVEAAFTLAQAWPCFPAGTVHLIVVDPGVGSARRAVIAEAGGHFFVAPDNGVLTPVRMAADWKIREITAERFFRQPVSRTFHGRDVFAPAAAHLACGIDPSAFGPEVGDPVLGGFGAPVETSAGVWAGAVLHVDRFGNIVTGFPSDAFRALARGPFELHVGSGQVTRYCETYASADEQPFVIAGSSGYMEVSVNQGDAARVLGVRSGDRVELRIP